MSTVRTKNEFHIHTPSRKRLLSVFQNSYPKFVSNYQTKIGKLTAEIRMECLGRSSFRPSSYQVWCLAKNTFKILCAYLSRPYGDGNQIILRAATCNGCVSSRLARKRRDFLDNVEELAGAEDESRGADEELRLQLREASATLTRALLAANRSKISATSSSSWI